MSPSDGPYLWRAFRYRALSRSQGAFREYQLFPRVELAAVSAVATTGPEPSLSPAWQQRLASTHTRQFVVLREGKLTGRWTAPNTLPDEPGRLYSVTKSVLSLAIGIALAEGLFPPLNKPVTVTLRGDQMTPRQLLRMDSGLSFDEGFASLGHQSKTYLHPNARRAALSSELTDAVSREFHYNDYHSLILGLLLEQSLERADWQPSLEASSMMPLVASWMYEKLLVPLGLGSAGAFVVDSWRHKFPKTESGLCLSALELASLGQLVLQGGNWQGVQLVPQAWLAESTGQENAWNAAEAFHRYRNLAWGPWLSTGRGWYGYHWWGTSYRGSSAVFAMGIHGQVLLVSPRHRAVVVRLADRWALQEWWPEVLLEGLETGEL